VKDAGCLAINIGSKLHNAYEIKSFLRDKTSMFTVFKPENLFRKNSIRFPSKLMQENVSLSFVLRKLLASAAYEYKIG